MYTTCVQLLRNHQTSNTSSFCNDLAIDMQMMIEIKRSKSAKFGQKMQIQRPGCYKRRNHKTNTLRSANLIWWIALSNLRVAQGNPKISCAAFVLGWDSERLRGTIGRPRLWCSRRATHRKRQNFFPPQTNSISFCYYCCNTPLEKSR